MATLEEIQAAAADPEKLQAVLAAHVEEAKAPLLRKRDELLGELTRDKSWKALSELGQTPEEVAAAVRKAKDLERQLEEERKTHEAGTTPEALQKLLDERLSEERDRIQKRAADETAKERQAREKLEESERKLRERLNRTRNEQDLYRIAGDAVHADLWDEFVGRLEPVMSRTEEGELVLKDPKTGLPLSGKSGDKTLEELVEDLRVSAGKERWDSKGSVFFKAGVGGGDHEGQAGKSGKRAPRKERSKMTDKERSDFIGEWGLSEYQKLPA